ncbi:hypothetical protein NAL32_08385 [Chryseobacterium sp. Ch-15]|uniref:Uncharacterized protein n=1 Tax=Chryseobacterium muglaense TaxID=2893752 RepID=A0A9Q3UXR1_9FLAO|nr:hypothetical protein [Chryseobacterium muglaense]MBD3903029.1 hypothetical protein [Chryseobacterium muglaense]MCC9035861.1 hypothetical protein [Chryseobacterium muglaense]MCM2554410.1 hypothetical protein [Chryseobacterium muglaense]
MQHTISEFLRKNKLKIDQDFNCLCSVTKKHNSTEQEDKSPFKIIFKEKSIVLLRINTPHPKEYHFGYEHVVNHSLERDKLKLTVKDWYYDNMYFEFDFLFIFNKYILDPFSVKKTDFETVIGKELYVVYSTSWYDEKKEMEGTLTRVGDLRIYIDDIENQKQEVEIFDLAYFFARL